MPLSRRLFLQSMAAPLAGGSVLGIGFQHRLRAADKPAADVGAKTPVVDTHVHCFAGKDNREFPYHPEGPYQPEPASSPELLLERMKQAEVDYAVIVHPEPYQDDHRYLEYCLKTGQGKLKGTCLFFAGRDQAIERLRELVGRNPEGIVALRVHAYAQERLPPFGQPALRNLWQAAGELGLALQLHFEPRFAAGFEPLIQEFSKTSVIIDHLGRPMQGTPAEHARIVRWARFDNTIMKLSAIPEQRDFPQREVAPIIRELATAYTADRLISGGGFDDKATGESYRKAREEVRNYLGQLSAADQAKVFGGTAVKLFRFDKPKA